ncbi:MAG: hypothetical protein U5R31_13240 [Acidimicrobiia bacterium]|nr:hypothetical protein [Acidimicrobiia bacterium]
MLVAALQSGKTILLDVPQDAVGDVHLLIQEHRDRDDGVEGLGPSHDDANSERARREVHEAQTSSSQGLTNLAQGCRGLLLCRFKLIHPALLLPHRD